MTRNGLTNDARRTTTTIMKRMARWGVLAPVLLGGCVSVSAPDKPIVINLNINITQQIVYKLDGQAKQLIQGNPDIF
jgi:hypothetical protein